MPAERFIDTNILLYGYDLDFSHGQDYGGIRAINPFLGLEEGGEP